MSKHDEQRYDGRGPGALPPVRWVDLAAAPPGSGDVERRIGALFARVSAPSDLNAVSQARIAARLRVSARRRTPPWSRRRLVAGWALGSVVLLVSGAVIAGGGVGRLWERLKPVLDAVSASDERVTPSGRSPSARGPRAVVAKRDVAAPALPAQATEPVPAAVEAEATASGPPRQQPQRPKQPEAAPPARARPRRSSGARYAAYEGRTAAAAAPTPAPAEAPRPATLSDAPVEPPPPSGAAVVEPPAFAPAPASSWASPAEPPPVPARRAPAAAPRLAPPSQLSQEARLLNTAMVQLRQRRDGAAALATLDEYLQHYPQGMLAAEARGARIDALLLLQRKGEALRALEAARLEPVGRGQELLVIRGELRARRDPAGAIRDFELVLGRAAPAPLEERALYGRAVSRRRQGDEKGARADAARYLTRFPEGRFASTVRRFADGDSGRTP